MPGEAGKKPTSRSYTPPKTPQGLASSIQKQITIAETSVSVSPSNIVISQGSVKPVKQISSTNSSRSASPQVTLPQVSLPQQYVIQQSPQHHAIYAMGLSQLGGVIPGLGPALDPAQQQSKTNETPSLRSTSTEQVNKTMPETSTYQNTVTTTSSVSGKSDDVSNSFTYSSVHPVIQTVSSSDKSSSSSSSTASHSTSINATVTVSSSTASVVSTPSIGGVIMNPYHQYYIAAAHAAQVAASTTPVVSSAATVASSSVAATVSPVTVAASSATPAASQAKEKAVTYTVNTSKSPVTSTTISSSTAVVTQPSATVATPNVMPTQMQYVVGTGAGNQQQLYAMPGNAHIQTGFLFFQQPNGVMVAIPAQTVIQPGGSSQVAVSPQVAAIANGAVAVQQKQKTPDTSTTGEKSRAKSESEATSEAASKQQKQLYLPIMQPQQQQHQAHELKLTSAKGKRSSSSTVSEDSTHKSSKDQTQSVRHHSASSATAGHTKYPQLYIPRGAHAYRVAAAQATAQEQAKNQQSTCVVTTSTTTSVTTSSATTLEKAKEGDEASASSSVVPIQVIHQQQYTRGDRHGMAQQSHKQMIASSASGGSGGSLRMAAVYTGGRPSVLFTAAGTPSSTAQTMLHAVAQGPSGVYEVKASTIADIDPISVKSLTEKYEHEIIKMDYQTAILNKSQSNENKESITSSVSNETSNKVTKTVSFASHKDQSRLSANQTPSSFSETIAAIDRTLGLQKTISDDVTTAATKQTKTGDNRKRAQTKKTPQADEKESAKPVASLADEPSAKQPQVTGARKRKGAKADLDSSQDTPQPPKRKRAPAKKKAAQAEDTEDENKPAKATPTQRGGRKGRAANETGKGGLKTAVVSISLDMLVDVPSPSEPDEVSEFYCTSFNVCFLMTVGR